MTSINEGLTAWQQPENNNKLLNLQWQQLDRSSGEVKIEFFGCLAYRITTPAGLTIMVDPWRNLPVTTMGIGQWFNHDFPPVIVDIGLSTHAHFDHDGLHRLHANMLMDRIVGEFSLGDVRIHGIAEKHVSDFSHCIYNFTESTMERGVDPRPPDNPRSWDNTLFIIETAGLRILHWGDNRPDPPEEVWRAIGEIDIALLPIDDSQHILSYEHVDDVLKRTRAKVCIPGHYRTRGLVRMYSTLMPADGWVRSQTDYEYLDSAEVVLSKSKIEGLDRQVLYFGDHLAFALPENTNREPFEAGWSG